MRYNGGKGAVAREVAQIINAYAPGNYWEPFVGAANVIQHVAAATRHGSDADPHIINYLQHVQAGYAFPDCVTEDDYQAWRAYEPISAEDYALRAFVGYGCSFGGKFFGGYARSGARNYALNAANSARKQRAYLGDITFGVADYREAREADVIYCDPPYAGTTRCGPSSGFDHAAFWDWCRGLPRETTVLVSEFRAPSDFVCVWEREIRDGLRKSSGEPMRERLFVRELP